ncbi:D-serine ammonia-lyase [Keratinibaculum paraultunense]|uniref:Probable D-serine dehydratase n=1 Tax=Keratinibaculum paraultunense TaxID=1278232 RepID=A0A4R3L4V5_9FIRM|nr:D-serine ammonia-lyase [Keratinibaculum paraultunense]QQY79979.1 D-serine ammonia-lyase [Keratinibaculum paraultunense]TCS91699.1 D-serine ammonia-lyase [Keratinibaculum paraultunense]
MNVTFTQKDKNSILEDIKSLKETVWINENYSKFKDVKKDLPLSYEDVLEAEKRLTRFQPFIKRAFPETKDGVIESPIMKIDNMKERMEKDFGKEIKGTLLLKRDDLLPIAGSIKARGGIYEVLKHAETLAINNNLLSIDDDYSVLAEDKFKEFFSNYTIQVGSTGNLGLSIGIISAKLGFKVKVHMSQDAKKWKKDLLRSKGVEVVEYTSDYSKAVEEGRKESENDPNSYFVDDENSKNLFLGYAVGGIRLKKQLDNMGIVVDKAHPLFVYLPCGVGGGPGGITYGLKLVYEDNVHCLFAEPTHSPAMLLGLITGLHDKVSVEDFGLDNKTDADGLAVGRPSSFVGKMMERLLMGIYTIDDSRLYKFLKALYEEEDIFLEPSALAGFLGPILFANEDNATHICWATGGSLVPEYVRKEYLKRV